LFADPDFDGDPVQIYEPGPGESPVPPDEQEGSGSPAGEWPTEIIDGESPCGVREPTRKFVVDDVEVNIVSERVQYLDANGKLITESLKDYTRKAVRKTYASLDAFLNAWNVADRKQA